ncbi:unnamed protein product [Urochloa humidicola]
MVDVTTVLSKLQEVASAELTAVLKVDDQIRNLRRGLVYLQAEVRGADQQRHGLASELLLLWSREARTVTFDVEDAVDEFHLKVEAFQVRLKSGGDWYASAVKLLNGLAMQFFVRHGLSREIEKINERIEEINKIKNSYNIQTTSSKHWSLTNADDAGVAWDVEYSGTADFRKQDSEALVEKILNPGGASISIIRGESGTGKTWLARRLYNCRPIRKEFEVFAWICLPPHIRFEEIKEMILDTVYSQLLITKKPAGGVSPSQANELRELLQGKKYLVVLDGLVDISSWNCLLNLLPGQKENPDGRILVTTQLNEKEIIKNAEPNCSKVLDNLDTIETFQLFRERVYGADAAPDTDWEQVEQEFSERVRRVTRGLPLAIIVLAGVLRTKAYPSEWKEVFAEKLETSLGEPKAMRCLWLLAFEDLPNHLRSCFVYLATAAETLLLDHARMVRLWIAEGFVVQSNGQTMEEAALGYLSELVQRGLVELVERDSRGRIKTVAIHSLLHSFVRAEAQESSFLKIHHNAGVVNPHTVRRLAIHNFVDSFVDIPDGFPKLRSLLCDFLEKKKRTGCWQQETAPTQSHQGSRFLRVIDLYGLQLQRVPDEIGNIIHLRYLGIRNCQLSHKLPASISRLDNLQTLDLRMTEVETDPDGLWEISGLRHVLADKLHLSRCPSIHLKKLQTLTGVVPAWSARTSVCGCPLNHMVYLRSLALCFIPADVMDALLPALHKMEFLVSLSLFAELLPYGVFKIPSSRQLEELALKGKLNSPKEGEEEFTFPNLGKIMLSRSGDLGKDIVRRVADLPNLTEMELHDGTYGESETELVFHKGGFRSLSKLTLNELEKLEKLELNPESVPHLTVITRCGCEKMKLYDNRSLQVSTGRTKTAMQKLSSMLHGILRNGRWVPWHGTRGEEVGKAGPAGNSQRDPKKLPRQILHQGVHLIMELTGAKGYVGWSRSAREPLHTVPEVDSESPIDVIDRGDDDLFTQLTSANNGNIGWSRSAPEPPRPAPESGSESVIDVIDRGDGDLITELPQAQGNVLWRRRLRQVATRPQQPHWQPFTEAA